MAHLRNGCLALLVSSLDFGGQLLVGSRGSGGHFSILGHYNPSLCRSVVAGGTRNTEVLFVSLKAPAAVWCWDLFQAHQLVLSPACSSKALESWSQWRAQVDGAALTLSHKELFKEIRKFLKSFLSINSLI